MKQLTITLLVILLSLNTFSQNKNDKEKESKHEIGLDILDFAKYKLSLSYNYLLDHNKSIGVDIDLYGHDYNLGNYSYYETIGVSVNYKHYFSKKKAQGLYSEAFVKYGFGNAYEKYADYRDRFVDYHSINVGLGIGYKHVFKNNLYLDINMKISQGLNKPNFNNSSNSFPSTFLMHGITIGKRF